jgi:hypothetical protein
MEELAIEYEPRLVEEAVLHALRGGAEETAFRKERDRLYEVADPEEREAGFRALHAAWFTRLGLEKGIDEALRAQPSITANAARCLVASASSTRDEGSELFVSIENGSGEAQRSVLIRLRPETITCPDRLRSLLRHELLHIADMLDPRFGYEPRFPPVAAGSVPERALRDRYRVLWDAYVDGRLARLGRARSGIRVERLNDFASVFPMLGKGTEHAFRHFFEGTNLTHAELVAFAADPKPTSSAISAMSFGMEPQRQQQQ